MKRYNPEIAYPETKDEQLVMCNSDDGNWVPAEVAQALYDALENLLDKSTNSDWASAQALAALSLADGDNND